MKVFINRWPVEGPWGGGNNFVKAIFQSSEKLDYTLIEDPFAEVPDVIFLQSPKPDERIGFSINHAILIKQKHPQVQVVLRVNECDARKATMGVDDLWIQCSKFVDKTIFVSNWMKKYFLDKGWLCKKNYVLYNGVNLEHFKPNKKLDNGKINIVTHHWSNNRMKGFDLYEELDDYVGKNSDKYTFTYIGRELGTFKNTIIIPPLFGHELGRELGKYDIYVSASKFDPGPNHILESVACNIPTFVCKEGGGALELASNQNVFEDFDQLISMIENNNYKNNQIFKVQSWENCMIELNKILKG